MSRFPDTSFLCALYRQQANSPEAIAILGEMTSPLTVSSLLLLEFRQSVRLQICLHTQDGTKGFSRTEGAGMRGACNLTLLEECCRSRRLIGPTSTAWRSN